MFETILFVCAAIAIFGGCLVLLYIVFGGIVLLIQHIIRKHDEKVALKTRINMYKEMSKNLRRY